MIDQSYKYGVGPWGRWTISCGLFALPMGIFVRVAPAIEHLTGQGGFLALFLTITAALLLLTRHLYRRLPNRTLMIVGSIGWLLGLFLFYLTARAIDL